MACGFRSRATEVASVSGLRRRRRLLVGVRDAEDSSAGVLAADRGWHLCILHHSQIIEQHLPCAIDSSPTKELASTLVDVREHAS